MSAEQIENDVIKEIHNKISDFYNITLNLNKQVKKNLLV